MHPPPTKPTNCCHVCSGTSYHHQISRNEQAELRSTTTLICDGCGRAFPDVKTWRDGDVTPGQALGA